MISRTSIIGNHPVEPLGNVVEFLDHMRKPVTESDRITGPYPYYGANGQQGSMNSYIFDEPLVLLAEDGGMFDQPDRGVAYRISGKTWVNNHAHVLRPTARINLGYLCRVLENYDLRPFISGSTRGKLTKGSALGIPVPVPPLAEQQRIASILDQADTLRAKRHQALTKIDTLTRSFFLDQFGDPTTNPKGWPIRKIGDLLESATYGTSEKSEMIGEFPVLRMNNITRTGEMDFTDLKFMNLDASLYNRYLVRSGDILFNRTNSAELVGKTGIFREAKPMAYAGYLIRLRVTQDNDPEFLAAFLNSGYSKKVLRHMCKSIIGMANINATEIQAMKIPQPPLSLQREFARQVTVLQKLKTAQHLSLSKLNTLFASLQSRAFKGEL